MKNVTFTDRDVYEFSEIQKAHKASIGKIDYDPSGSLSFNARAYSWLTYHFKNNFDGGMRFLDAVRKFNKNNTVRN